MGRLPLIIIIKEKKKNDHQYTLGWREIRERDREKEIPENARRVIS